MFHFQYISMHKVFSTVVEGRFIVKHRKAVFPKLISSRTPFGFEKLSRILTSLLT